ncbi:hypothetical protein Trydic_g21564 [Trypoxylus dichotomus]
MSDTESEQECSEDGSSEMLFIAEKVRVHPKILEKSQMPAMKVKKTTVLIKIVEEYTILFGKHLDIKTFMKKVNNMKTRLKNKTDKNKTRGKPIRLLLWEKVMLEAMNADINPALSQIPGADIASTSTLQPSSPTLMDASMRESDAYQMIMSGIVENRKRSSLTQELASNKLAQKPKLLPKSSVVDARSEESDETRHLTGVQLQRLVLLEQLKLIRLQHEYFYSKIQKLAQTDKKEPSIVYSVTGDQSYCNL